ncbi:hypothetical protein CUMW_229130 [Citrus unshiu]|uniref:Uncharacterized protein n=1 Tax=Citrus unshiu TaxID=55188 RepID=A0A2H5QI16_CITUN|nr:hypothetical protein CUMW_229130 [Citrus unshiu]
MFRVDDKNDTSNDPNVEEIIKPKIGMVCYTNLDLFESYKKNGKFMGFEIIKRTSSKGDDEELKYVTSSCSPSGKPKSLLNHPFRLQPTTKTNCKVKVRATTCLDRKWEVMSRYGKITCQPANLPKSTCKTPSTVGNFVGYNGFGISNLNSLRVVSEFGIEKKYVKYQPRSSRHKTLHRLVVFSTAATTRRHQLFLFSLNFTNTATTHDHEELEEGEYEEDEVEVDEDEEEENGSVHDDGEGEREADTENYESENDLQHRELQPVLKMRVEKT